MNSKKPTDIEDIDDDSFVSRKPQDYIFADKADQIRERTASSIKNSLRMINESENIGIDTLGTLAEQREQLERIEADLDNINAITRFTQKHINSMNSFFGGLFSRKSSKNNPPIPTSSRRNEPIPKSATFSDVKSVANNFNNNAAYSNKMAAQKANATNTVSSAARGLSRDSNRANSVEETIEEDLSKMCDGVGRMKDLALKLGDEIDGQNCLLDRVTDKSERANDSIVNQNRQINQILKK